MTETRRNTPITRSQRAVGSQTNPTGDRGLRRTLQVKLFATVAALALVGMVSLVELSIWRHHSQTLDGIARHGIRRVMDQPMEARESLLTADQESFERFGNHLFDDPSIAFVRMTPRPGDDAWVVARESAAADANPTPSQEQAQKGPRLLRQEGSRMLEVAIPLRQIAMPDRRPGDGPTGASERDGMLWVGVDATNAFASSMAAARQTRQAQAFIAALVLLGLWIVTRRALRPIEMLVEDAERIAHGQQPVASVTHRSSETRRLQRALNALSGKYGRAEASPYDRRFESFESTASNAHRPAPPASARSYSALRPRTDSPSAQPLGTRTPTRGRKWRVLLVEDNPVNQTVAVKMLEEVGCVVECARDGVEALARFESDRFDVLFMDIQMPKMDGLEATRKIRAIEAELDSDPTPIIALTAHSGPRDLTACRIAGMNGHIGKPFAKDDLEQALLEWSSPAKSIETGEPAPDRNEPGPAAEGCAAEGTPGNGSLGEVLDNGVFSNTMAACGADDEFLQELVDAFANRTRDLGASCAKAISDGSRSEVESAAHEIKSSSGQMGATRLQGIAAELESLASANGADMAPLGTELLEEIDLACEALRQAARIHGGQR